MRWQWVVTMNEEQKLRGEHLFRRDKKKGQGFVENLLAGKMYKDGKCHEFAEHVKVIRHRNGIVTVKFSKEFPYPLMARDYVEFCKNHSEHAPAPIRPYVRRRAVQSPPPQQTPPFEAETDSANGRAQYLVTIDKDNAADVSATVGAIMQIKGVKTVEVLKEKSEADVKKQCGAVLNNLAKLWGCSLGEASGDCAEAVRAG